MLTCGHRNDCPCHSPSSWPGLSGPPKPAPCRDRWHQQTGKRRPPFLLLAAPNFEKTRLSLKNYLLTEGYAGDDEDAFDRAMREIRAAGSPFVTPGTADLSE